MSSPEEPTGSNQERMDAISGALARLARRQDELDQRLARIETAAGLSAVPAPRPEAPPAIVEPPPLPQPPPLPSAVPPPTALEPKDSLETTFGLGWLNRVAVVTLIFGVGFLFKYAIDNQWIGPGMRVALGIAAATLSLFLGEWISLRGQRVFARGLTGLGLALLYLSFYASFGFYHLLPQSVAFLCMFLTTGAAVALAWHYDSQAVALLGLAGGYLTPVLLSTGENHMSVLAAYTLVLNLGAVTIARVKRWPGLEYLAWPATGLLFSGWANDWLDDQNRLVAFLWLSVTFLLFFAASVVGSRLRLLALNSAAYFSASLALLDHQYHRSMGMFTVGLAMLHAVVARGAWNKEPRLGQLTAAIAAVLLTLAVPIQFVGFRITMLWALEAAAIAWLAARFGAPRLQLGAWLLFTLVFIRLLTLDGQIFAFRYTYAALANRRFATFAVAAGSLWIASRFAQSRESQAVTYGGGHLVLLWALAMEVNGWAHRTADLPDASSIASTGISILMAVYGLALVVAGVSLRSTTNRVMGLGLMALVIAKLYLLDVWSLSRGFRITAFLALGVLLLLVSYLYSRFKPAIAKLWNDQPPAENTSV